ARSRDHAGWGSGSVEGRRRVAFDNAHQHAPPRPYARRSFTPLLHRGRFWTQGALCSFAERRPTRQLAPARTTPQAGRTPGRRLLRPAPTRGERRVLRSEVWGGAPPGDPVHELDGVLRSDFACREPYPG